MKIALKFRYLLLLATVLLLAPHLAAIAQGLDMPEFNYVL